MRQQAVAKAKSLYQSVADKAKVAAAKVKGEVRWGRGARCARARAKITAPHCSALPLFDTPPVLLV